MKLTGRQVREYHVPGTYWATILKSKEKWGGEKISFVFLRVEVMLPSLAPPLGWAGEFAYLYVVKLLPTRLPRPWDSPGKNTGVGCHFLLQCRKVKNEREVAQSCPTLSDPMDCSPPGSSIHGIFQARVLEWGAIAFSEHVLGTINLQSSLSRTWISCYHIFFIVLGQVLCFCLIVLLLNKPAWFCG